MKSLLTILFVAFALCFTFGYQFGEKVSAASLDPDQSEDEATIRKIMNKSIDAMTNHDIKAHLSTITEEYEVWSGRKKHEDREKGLAEYWQRQKSIRYTIVKVNSINFITPDAAIFNARVESASQVKKDGTPAPDAEWQGVWILTKKNGKWLIAAWYTRAVGD
jgi:ketosteroid isomerase-like protein